MGVDRDGFDFMIILLSTDLLELVTGQARTVDVHASFVDWNGVSATPGRDDTLITTAVTTTIVGSPAANVFRTVKTLTIRNREAVNSVDVTLQHDDGSANHEMVKVTLQAGQTLSWVEGGGFAVGVAPYLPITGGTLTGVLTLNDDLKFGNDNLDDIGAAGANRPRSIYVGTDVRIGNAMIVGATPAVTGSIRLVNGATILGRNAANSLDLTMMALDGGNNLYLGGGPGVNSVADIIWGRAMVALGGGATPTLGTIGGSGPGTAAQNSWMRALDNAGNPFWVPVWR